MYYTKKIFKCKYLFYSPSFSTALNTNVQVYSSVASSIEVLFNFIVKVPLSFPLATTFVRSSVTLFSIAVYLAVVSSLTAQLIVTSAS